MALVDVTGGVGYPFGAVLPSSHMTTIATQQPRAVDGGTPVAGVYPGTIEFSGDHYFKSGGSVDFESGSELALDGGSNLLINGTLNGTPTGGTIDLTAVNLGLDGISVDDIDFHDTEATPTISQSQQAGTSGTDGYPLSIIAQQGQDGNGNPAGDGGDLVLGLGLPGSGTPDGDFGRLIRQWGDSASYKWTVYEWSTGEFVYVPGTTYPLAVAIADGEVHICTVDVMARGGPTAVVWERINAIIRADSGTVTIANVSPIGAAPNFGIGATTALTTFSFDGTNPNEWRIGIAGAGGDAVIFAKWSVASLDGV